MRKLSRSIPLHWRHFLGGLIILALCLAPNSGSAEDEDRTNNPFYGMYWVQTCASEEGKALCYAFLRGIQGVNELLTATKRPIWCEPYVVSPEQLREIFIKTLSDEAARIHDEPASGIAVLGLMRAFPCKRALH